MNNFFDRFKPKKKGESSGGGGFSLNLPGMKKSFQGSGQSLGGSKPGKVIEVQLDQPGSLGIKIEKRPGTNSAIVATVVEGSQADKAGLRRGDILCFQGTHDRGVGGRSVDSNRVKDYFYFSLKHISQSWRH